MGKGNDERNSHTEHPLFDFFPEIKSLFNNPLKIFSNISKDFDFPPIWETEEHPTNWIPLNQTHHILSSSNAPQQTFGNKPLSLRDSILLPEARGPGLLERISHRKNTSIGNSTTPFLSKDHNFFNSSYGSTRITFSSHPDGVSYIYIYTYIMCKYDLEIFL